ncbi:MAG: hypothetical protein V2B19_09735 [Pseudomonadota bacterium]
MIEEVIETLTALLQGGIPETIDTGKDANETEQKLGQVVNQLIGFMLEIQKFIIPLSHGKLNGISVQPKNFLASPFKELHSRLLHLSWQATQVAKGDYKQRVDFMGDFSEAFNSMIMSLEHNEKLLKNKIDELEKALCHIVKLEGILPICSSCKSIRLEGAAQANQDSWIPIERYISNRTEARFSHSICPKCYKKLYPEYME